MVRSAAAATGGGLGDGLTVSLLERFIEAHTVDVPRLLEAGRAPATGEGNFQNMIDAALAPPLSG